MSLHLSCSLLVMTVMGSRYSVGKCKKKIQTYVLGFAASKFSCVAVVSGRRDVQGGRVLLLSVLRVSSPAWLKGIGNGRFAGVGALAAGSVRLLTQWFVYRRNRKQFSYATCFYSLFLKFTFCPFELVLKPI